MTEDDLKVLRAEIAFAIKTTVNGKIDDMRDDLKEHNEKHEQDMERLMPIIQAYESSEAALSGAKASGKVLLWIAGFITAIGGAWLILKSIFPWL